MILGSSLEAQRSSGTTLVGVQDWLTQISPIYVEQLDQRRPEALVILAHFAVLLHRAADNWFIGDLGSQLIHRINSQLGAHWEEWLAWPNSMLQQKNSPL